MPPKNYIYNVTSFLFSKVAEGILHLNAKGCHGFNGQEDSVLSQKSTEVNGQTNGQDMHFSITFYIYIYYIYIYYTIYILLYVTFLRFLTFQEEDN